MRTEARVRFFPNGTSDEMTLIMHSGDQYRKITLEVTTGLASVEVDAMKKQITGARIARRAFTLLEVMFAMVAFCMATFVILALVSNSLSQRAPVAAADGGRGSVGGRIVANQPDR